MTKWAYLLYFTSFTKLKYLKLFNWSQCRIKARFYVLNRLRIFPFNMTITMITFFFWFGFRRFFQFSSWFTIYTAALGFFTTHILIIHGAFGPGNFFGWVGLWFFEFYFDRNLTGGCWFFLYLSNGRTRWRTCNLVSAFHGLNDGSHEQREAKKRQVASTICLLPSGT